MNLNGVGSTSAVFVDAINPTVTSITRLNPTGNLTNGTSVTFKVTFSEEVTGVSTDDFSLTRTGNVSGTISSVSASVGESINVTVNSITGDGTLRLDLNNNGTNIQDNATNPIAGGFTSGETYTFDHTLPTVSSVGVPSNAIYKAGQNLDFTVNFGEAVTVVTTGGTPYITVNLNSGTVYATYLSGSGTNALIFRYTVVSGDNDDNGVTLGSSITLNGGVLKDASGNDSRLTLNNMGNTSLVKVDAVVPTSSVTVPKNALKIGETTSVTFTFSESVSGFSTADILAPNGTLTSLFSVDGGITWTATYTPNANVEDATNILTLDNTGISDVAGNPGIGTSNSNNFAIDTKRPTAGISLSDNALKESETAVVTITFSEAITGLTLSDFTVSNGTIGMLGSSDGGITWTATLTPDENIEEASNLITLDRIRQYLFLQLWN